MADNPQDQKDYQDYVDYQKYQASQGSKAPDFGQEHPYLQGLSKLLSANQAIQGGLIKGGSLGNIDPSKLDVPGNPYKQGAEDWPKLNKASQVAGHVASGAGIGEIAAGGMLAGKGVSALASRIAGNTGAGGLAGYLRKPEGGQTRAGNAVHDAGISGMISSAGEAVGPFVGNLADRLQQKAMGLKKYLPGVGSTAIDEGIRGTRAGMSGQVKSSLADTGEAAGKEVANLGRIDSNQASKPVAEYAQSFKVGDTVPANSITQYGNASQRAGEIATRGEVSAPDAWKFSQLAGKAGYKAQKAKETEAAYLAQLEQQGYSSSLKEASDAAGGNLSDQFAKMSNLYKAKNALKQPTSITAGLPLTVLAGASAGYGSDRSLTGAAKGALGALALRSPVVQSYGAGAMSGASKAIQDPATLQAILSLFHSVQDKDDQGK